MTSLFKYKLYVLNIYVYAFKTAFLNELFALFFMYTEGVSKRRENLHKITNPQKNAQCV